MALKQTRTIKAITNMALQNGEDSLQAKIDATAEARTQAAENFIKAYANTYQHGGFFDNTIAAKSIIAATDVGFFKELLEEYGIEPSEQIQKIIAENEEPEKKKILKRKRPLQKLKKKRYEEKKRLKQMYITR